MTHLGMPPQTPIAPKSESQETYETATRVFAAGVILGAAILIAAISLFVYGLAEDRTEFAMMGASIAVAGVTTLLAGVIGGHVLRMLALIARGHGA